jgi:hypothetical protein
MKIVELEVLEENEDLKNKNEKEIEDAYIQLSSHGLKKVYEEVEQLQKSGKKS